MHDLWCLWLMQSYGGAPQLYFANFGVVLSWAVGLVPLTFAVQVEAQSVPPNLQNLPDPNLRRSPQPSVPVPQPLPTVPLEIPRPSAPPPSVPDSPGSITVLRFEFEGNTAFSENELAAVTAPYTGRPITFAELLQAEAAVTQKYTQAGYINSGAVILAGQTLDPERAVVKVQILEGGIEDLRIAGTRRLKPRYIRDRLKSAIQRPLNQKRLLRALQVLQLNPLIERLSADLSAGPRPESSFLSVTIQEAPSLRAEVFADNGRSPSVGSFRRGIRVTQANLLGFGDGLGFEYSNTNGSNAFSLRYEIPVNAQNGTVSLVGAASFSDVIERPFNRIDIIGNSYSVDLSYRQPLIQTPTQEFALGITASRQENQALVGGFNFSESADENGRTRVNAVRFFQDWTQRSSQSVLSVRSQFNLGLGILDTTQNAMAPDGRFFSWQGQAQYVRAFAPDTLLVLRSNLQLSANSLLSQEQIALGGQQTVRGYRQDSLLTDNGFFTSVELRLPILRVKKVKGVLQLAPFIDVGLGWNRLPRTNPDPNTLAGVGLGLQWQMGDDLTARFDWGIPLTHIQSSKNTLQEQGLYFSINYSPF